MKKIGILTFHWADDFGAMLQAYALKTCIENLGCSVQIIPYSKKDFVGRYWLWPYASFSGKPCGLKGINQYRTFRKNLKHFSFFLTKRSKMRRFRKHFLCHNINTSRIRKLKLSSYDRIFIGSDQVWNPELTVGVNEIYWGNFEKKPDAKVFSYAASIGSDNLSSAEKELISSYVNNFEAITVREKASIPMLRELTSKNVEDMPDPTLLCTKNDWECLYRKKEFSEQPEKYIVLHSTEHNSKMTSYVQKLHEETGFKVIDIREDSPNDPLDFLNIMAHAEYVVTNSFHGTVFSILLERQFVSFSHSNKNTRLKDLLENTGLSDRLSPDHSTETIYSSIDWPSVNFKVDNLREKGITFLQKALV